MNKRTKKVKHHRRGVTKMSRSELRLEMSQLRRELRQITCVDRIAKYRRLRSLENELIHRVTGSRRPMRPVQGGAPGLGKRH
jgi:hypothetical protein